MTITEKLAAITTTEQAEAHQDKCKAMIKCDHSAKAAGKVNEYGDCFDCDGEPGEMRMCPCQSWTFAYVESLG